MSLTQFIEGSLKNAGNDQLNVVYRRKDGNIGWIDPTKCSA